MTHLDLHCEAHANRVLGSSIHFGKTMNPRFASQRSV